MSDSKIFRQDTFTLPEGVAVIQWPDGMSNESFVDFTDWLLLQHRKIRRSVKSEEGQKSPSINIKEE